MRKNTGPNMYGCPTSTLEHDCHNHDPFKSMFLVVPKPVITENTGFETKTGLHVELDFKTINPFKSMFLVIPEPGITEKTGFETKNGLHVEHDFQSHDPFKSMSLVIHWSGIANKHVSKQKTYIF